MSQRTSGGKLHTGVLVSTYMQALSGKTTAYLRSRERSLPVPLLIRTFRCVVYVCVGCSSL